MRAWLLFGLLFIALISSMPMLPLAHQGVLLLISALVLWVFRPLPELHTALLIPSVAIPLQLVSLDTAANIASNPMLMVFFFGFAFAALSRHHQLDKLVMVAIGRFANGSERRACWMVFVATWMLSCWTSNVVTTALMLPLGMVLAGTDSITKQHFYALGIVFSATFGGMATPIGSSASLIASNMIGFDLLEWIALAAPCALLLWIAAITLLRWLHKPQFEQKITIEPTKAKPTQWLSLAVVFTTLGGYVVAAVISRSNGFWPGYVPLLGLLVLVGCRLLTPRQIANAIKYRVLFIFFSALILGYSLTTTGADKLILETLTPMLEPLPFALQLGLLLMFIAALTELMSNVACTAILAPLFMVLLVPQGTPIELIGLLVGIGCCSGFILPTATPANSLAIGVGAISSRQLRSSGIRVKAITFLLLFVILLLFQGYLTKL